MFSDVTFHLKMAVRNNPSFMQVLGRIGERPWNQRRVLRKGDDVLIDGFPRSANTFATYAFAAAQPRQIRMGNHLHSPAQFFLAARFGIPAMLVLRNPVDAIASFMLYRPGIDARQGLMRYISFHQPLLALKDNFIVVPFDEVVSDFGVSIQRLNAHFGCSFLEFEHSDESARQTLAAIDADRQRRFKIERASESKSPLSKQEAQASLRAASLTDLVQKAREVYFQIAEPPMV